MLLLQEGRINPGYLCDTNNWSLFRSYWSTIYWSPHLFFMMRIISKTLHDYCICFHYRCYSHHSYVRADYHGDVVVFTITCHHHHHHISSVCLSNFSLVIITKSITIIFPPPPRHHHQSTSPILPMDKVLHRFRQQFCHQFQQSIPTCL